MEPTEEVTTTESNEKGKKGHKRSASYPSLTVDEAYKFACKINDNFSVASAVKREEIAHVLGLHTNTVSRDVAACVQYGLLSKAANEGYKLTELFNDIFRPESEKEKRIKLILAFGNPKLYQELIAKFDGHVIPLEFANTLIKHHGITESASKAAAETFLQSGVNVGVIGENRVLKYNVTLSSISKTQFAEIVEDTNNTNDKAKERAIGTLVIQPTEEIPAPDAKKIPMHLTKEKMAYLMYPSNITENDVKLIEHQLAGIIMRIKFESESEK